MGNSLTLDTDKPGTPFDFGSGVVNPMGALQPGLLYETTTEDYFHLLCNYGLNSSQIKFIATNESYKCPSGAKVDLISNLNYPSIAISKLDIANGSTTIKKVSQTSALIRHPLTRFPLMHPWVECKGLSINSSILPDIH